MWTNHIRSTSAFCLMGGTSSLQHDHCSSGGHGVTGEGMEATKVIAAPSHQLGWSDENNQIAVDSLRWLIGKICRKPLFEPSMKRVSWIFCQIFVISGINRFDHFGFPRRWFSSFLQMGGHSPAVGVYYGISYVVMVDAIWGLPSLGLPSLSKWIHDYGNHRVKPWLVKPWTKRPVGSAWQYNPIAYLPCWINKPYDWWTLWHLLSMIFTCFHHDAWRTARYLPTILFVSFDHDPPQLTQLKASFG